MLLEIKNITKNYNESRGINNINLEFECGHVIGLLGSNGSGKTTLIKLINGLLTPDEGKILVDGKKIGVETKKIISYLPDQTYIENAMSIKECINFFKDFYEDFDEDKAKNILNKFEIPLNKKFGQLSKGNKEKLQLALVMSRNAKLYILDEPIAGVDPGIRDFVIQTAIDAMSPDSSLIICTHLVRDIEPFLDDVAFLNKGNVVIHKSKEIILTKYESLVDLFKEVYQCS